MAGATAERVDAPSSTAAAVIASLGGPLTMAAVLAEVTMDVFETMVNRSLVPSGPATVVDASPLGSVVGTVSFTGSVNGVVAFGTSQPTALAIAASLLCCEPDEVGDGLPDAIGEVSNMVGGAFRSHVAEDGTGWSIAVPVVSVGQDLTVNFAKSATRVRCPFKMGDDEVFVELVLQTE